MDSFNVMAIPGPTCSGYTKGAVIFTGCWGGVGDFIRSDDPPRNTRGLFAADITSFETLTYDNIYLSLTEIRSGSLFTGEANIYFANAPISTPYVAGPGGGAAFLPAADAALSAGTTLVGSLTGSGVGGNHLLLNVTSAIQAALLNGIDLLAIYLEDEIDDGLLLGVLGNNYNSGNPECGTGNDRPNPLEVCQYYADSLYEYPTLIATSGTEITPFNQLAPRPITDDPLEPPPPSLSIPEPTTLALIALGVAGIGYSRRKH